MTLDCRSVYHGLETAYGDDAVYMLGERLGFTLLARDGRPIDSMCRPLPQQSDDDPIRDMYSIATLAPLNTGNNAFCIIRSTVTDSG